MCAMINGKARFATEGFRVKRLNPDGTVPTASRFLGFLGTVDLTAVLTASAANMSIKIDNAAADENAVDFTAADENSVDFTAASSQAAVTVAEAVTALTAAAFTGITWSADVTTGRLMGVSASGTEVEVTGPLAAALDFGQGVEHGGNGLEFLRSFNDDTMSIGETKNKKDKEEIDQEGAKGTITRMVIGAKLLGKSLAIAVKTKNYYLLEAIQGGTLNRSTGKYTPPPSTRQNAPLFFVDTFAPLYGEGESKMENFVGYEQQRYVNCIGMEGDVPQEAKAWANYSFDVEAGEGKDASGNKIPAWYEQPLSVAEFEALHVETV